MDARYVTDSSGWRPVMVSQSLKRVLAEQIRGTLTVKVDVDFLILTVRPEVFVALFVQDAGGFSVSFAHQTVLGLTAEGESFGGAGIMSIVCLSSTTRSEY